jgi:hypothetical protein
VADILVTETLSGPERLYSPSYVQWSPIIAGAIAAAALALVLQSFAAAIGLAVSSTAPSWRDASVGLWILSGLYLVLVAIAAYGLGGYVAGRMREPFADVTDVEKETRDGTNGLLVWALATLLTAAMVGLIVPAVSRIAAPSPVATAPSASSSGENLIAFDLDHLFRGSRLAGNADLEYPRAEAARILLTAGGHEGVSDDDHAYLVRRVSEITGLAPADAQRRVDVSITSARQDIQRARHAAVLLAFCAGAAALLGAAVAWFSACRGGHHRDTGEIPMWGSR